MTKQLAISPDVNVKNITDWFIFNTKLQRITGETFHATTYDDFADMHRAFSDGRADLVLANAADTTTLVREHGFLPVATPAEVSNEASIVVADSSGIESLSDFGTEITVAATDAPDVERICRILLEPADLGPEQIHIRNKPNPVLVAKAVLNSEVHAGFFPQAAYLELSRVIRRQLHPVITSQIYVVRHSLLASPELGDLVDKLWAGLAAMNDNPADEDLLVALGAPHGWQRLSSEEAEFMIDLMDALAQS